MSSLEIEIRNRGVLISMSRNSFTLIDLVMVIVILGIISVVVIPKIVSLKIEADKAECESNVGAIRAALSNFYQQCSFSNTACPNGVACNLSNCFPNSTELDTLTSKFAQNYFTDKTLPKVSAAIVRWSDVYNATTGLINNTQCCRGQ